MSYVIEWDGDDYVIPERGFFEVMEAIESHVTLPHLLQMVATGHIEYAKLARPLHALLHHAGVPNVSDLRELRRGLIAESFARLEAIGRGDEPPEGQAMQIINVISAILMDEAPDSVKQDAVDAGKKTRPRSSKPATKSRSGNGASRRVNSRK